MVRKEGKNGVRSGNTLRAANSGYSRQYHSESFIVRKCRNINRQQVSIHQADDALIDADGVYYSLNKKGRWSLPALIEENIRSGKHSDSTISMYKHHKIARQSNCVEFHCNKGDVKKIALKHGYFNEASFKPGRKVRRNARRLNNQFDQELEPDNPEVKYDVFYPTPATSSLSHNSKYVRNVDTFVLQHGNLKIIPKPKKRGRCSKQRSGVVVEDYFALNNDDCSSYEDQCNENDGDCHSYLDEDEKSPEVMLSDLLKAAKRAKDLCEERSKRMKVKKDKSTLEDAWVMVNKRDVKYIDVDQFEQQTIEDNTSFQKRSQFSSTPILESVRVLLECDDVREDKLKKQYGHLYTEARSFPRKFVIDTSSAVYTAMKTSKFANSVFLSGLDLTSYIIFTREAMYDTGIDVYTVKFNIACNLLYMKLENVCDLMHTSVDEVFNSAAQFASTLPPETFHKREVNATAASKDKAMSLETVSEVNKWASQTFCLLDINVEEVPECVENDAAFVDLEDETCGAEHCNICFDDINPLLLESVPSTCLMSCRHWFCDSCWKEHLCQSIHSGFSTLKCPEYECESEVDIPFALSLVGVKNVLIFQRQKKSTDVEIDSSLKWCPNSKCGRVLQTQQGGTTSCVSVTCKCGKVVCFHCLKDAHWPASCNQATNYIRALAKNGHDFVSEEESSLAIRGKNCPKCNRYIEKNGGCKTIMCICRHHFCWACSRSISDHPRTWELCNATSDYYQTQNKKLVDVFNENAGNSNMYKLAVDNRIQRQPKMVKELRRNVKHLGVQLEDLIERGHGVSIDSNRLASPEQVRTLLDHSMQVKLELNHVIQYTAVLLDGENVKSGSRKLSNICKVLGVLSHCIQGILSHTGKADILKIIPRLVYLRQRAKCGLKALVEHIENVECAVENER